MKGFTVFAVYFIFACVGTPGQNSPLPFYKHPEFYKQKSEKFEIRKSVKNEPVFKTQTSSFPITPNNNPKAVLPKGTFLIQEIIIDDTCKNICKYDNKLNEIEIRSEVLQNGSWRVIQHITKTYDSDSHLTLALIEDFQNNSWNNFLLDTFLYDQKGNLIKEQGFFWINSSWTLIVTDSLCYDDNSRPLSEIVLCYNENGNGNIQSQYTFDYSYDKYGNQLSKINKGWIKDQGSYYFSETYAYDSFNNMILSEYEELSITGYLNKYKIYYEYDSDRNMTRTRTENWNDASWKLTYINYYYYDTKGNRYLTINNYYPDSTRVYSRKEYRTFDERKNCLTILYQSLSDSAWVNSEKTTYQYNSMNKKTMELVEYRRNESWEPRYKYIYDFDDNGNLLLESYRNYEVLQKENGYTYQYKYDLSGCLTYADYFTWTNGVKYPDNGMIQMTLYNKALNLFYCCHTLNVNYSVVTGNKGDLQLTTAFSLEQNYPNPFNPATKINYTIPQASKVILKIFDITGKELFTLINKEQLAGNYSVDFNGAGLASGIYFYRIFNGTNILTRKMILLR